MDIQDKLRSLLNQLNTVIVGKPDQIRDCVACLLAGGHLLIDDVPGVGKTTLAHALSRTFGCEVVAEGVETPAQAQRLLELGCGIGQGNGIAAAMQPSALSGWIDAFGQSDWAGQLRSASQAPL